MSVYIGRCIVYSYIRIFAVLSRASIIVSREQYSTYSLGYFWFFFFRRTQLLAELLYYFISIVFPFRQERKKRKLSFEMINFCCVHTSHHSRSWTIDAERRVWLVWWRISHKKRPLVLRQHAIVLLYIVLAQLSSDYMVAYRERVLRDFRLSIVTFTFVSQEYIQLCSI